MHRPRMPDRMPDEPSLDLPKSDAPEHLDEAARRAQAELLELQRKAEALGRRQRELDEAARKQEQFIEGRKVVVTDFTRALVTIERETYEAQKRVERLKQVHASFLQHLEELEGINPADWEGADIPFIQKELSKAIGAVEDARAEFDAARAVINAGTQNDEVIPASAFAPAQDAAEPPQDFGYWLKAGFAFTLPLFALGVLLLIVVFLSLTKP